MAVMNCYTDVGGSPSEIVTSPAMLVSSPDKWLDFDRRWNETLRLFGFTELHMKKFAHFKGEYGPLRFNEQKRRRFLDALMVIIEDCVEYTAAQSVYNDDYAYHDRHYQLSEWMRPYTMGCLACAGRVTLWASEQGHAKNDFSWFFEKGDQDQEDLRKHWNRAYPDASVDPIFLKKCDVHLSDKPRHIRPFEAADLIGFENLQTHKRLGKEMGIIPFESLRAPMQRLSNLRGAEHWGYISEREILKWCEKYQIPHRDV